MTAFDFFALFFSSPFLLVLSSSLLFTVFYFLFAIVSLLFSDEGGEKDVR